MMLSTGKRGKPIAIGSKGTVIRLVEKTETEKTKRVDPYDLINDKDLKKYKKKIPSSDHKKIKKMLLSNEEPDDEEDYLKDIYKDMKPGLDEKIKTELVFHDETLMLLPKVGTSTFIYVTAPTGAGKSTWISEYLKKYRELKPDKEMFLFSDTPQDEPLDKYEPTRIMINDNLVKKPIKPEELKDSITIFDDVDSIANKDQKKSVNTLYDSCLKKARHSNVDLIITSHSACDYHATRNILINCQYITCFPSGGSPATLIRLFKNYLGLNKEQINKILKLPSRWITIHTQYPQFVLYSSGVYLLANN